MVHLVLEFSPRKNVYISCLRHMPDGLYTDMAHSCGTKKACICSLMIALLSSPMQSKKKGWFTNINLDRLEPLGLSKNKRSFTLVFPGDDALRAPERASVSGLIGIFSII
jgi:hypothetical protein